MGVSIGSKWTISQDYFAQAPANCRLAIQAISIGKDAAGTPGLGTDELRQNIMSGGNTLLTQGNARGWSVAILVPRAPKLLLYAEPSTNRLWYQLPAGYFPDSFQIYNWTKSITGPYIAEGTTISNIIYYEDSYYGDYRIYFELDTPWVVTPPFAANSYYTIGETDESPYRLLAFEVFDTYGDSAQADKLANYLLYYSRMCQNAITVITTYDAAGTPSSNNLINVDSQLVNYFNADIHRFNRSFRDSYMFIGVPGYPPIYESHRPHYDEAITFSGWIS